MKRIASIVTLCVAGLLVACGEQDQQAAAQPPARAQAAGPAVTAVESAGLYADPAGIDRSGFDLDVRPQDDFFRYVNGGWIARTVIPADRTWWGVIPELRAESENQQRSIIEEMAARTDLAPDSVEQKIGALFASLTDQSLVEGKGVAPIAGTLEAIAAIASVKDLEAFFGSANSLGVDTPLGVGVVSDPGAENRYISYVWQSGLGLPDRDYYLSGDQKFRKLRADYPHYIGRLLELGGFGGTAEQAQAVFAIEQRLAEAHWPAEQNRDMNKLYNLVKTESLVEVAPDFDWPAYLEAASLGGRAELMVSQLSYFQALGAIVEGFGLDAWKDYLRFHALDAAAPWLSGEFEQAQFDFMQQEVLGLEEQAPVWKRAVRAIDGLVGEAIGRVYVERYFPAQDKQSMRQLVDNLLEAFRAGIVNLTWMGEQTKQRAEEKLARLDTKIGYPNKWRDYSGLEVRADDPLGNLQRARDFEYRFQLAKLDLPIDREEWEMTPQTVNAYNEPFKNEIVFPAAFLQPPNFNMAADPAVNYGAIGYVIGHEIGHAFDDKGRAFDAYGKLNDWWTTEDAAHYEQAAARLVDQYNAFSPLEGMSINGRLTLGENIADLTGITIAYRAYHASLGGKEAPLIDGMSGDQRFFFGFAQANRAVMREAFLRSMLVSDPHSPSEFRVLGVLRNFTPFYEAFGVMEGDRMYLPPEQRVRIW
ncbi:MAG: M13 family metallopeptidase [Pseudomonadales bacterium]|nr:M13 family metallopeptidase [Gammaproteobacteria bacterium]MBK6584830.1 M13 family metallopeptidase [Gammaproteobacteria bacterium]MBK7519660.1 M13 family metallopeptidase [Gammaproteobacteria bacterium]MBP6052380.1 M13 family metallopeptidase [Pseudomonadales bacterium]MBP6227469.1 M13 family metallopeptidase [Pseudomonadales bacterium]